ncbi:hypothetical protein HAX54_028973, partial [Datura stramonium]|nr:hypothetical protein [Datura stramonium]
MGNSKHKASYVNRFLYRPGRRYGMLATGPGDYCNGGIPAAVRPCGRRELEVGFKWEILGYFSLFPKGERVRSEGSFFSRAENCCTK